jgi:hypothetical protein
MRQPKIKVRRYNERKRPRLKFVVNYREAGKRKRSFFETKRQADTFASFKNSELKQNGIEHAEFPSARHGTERLATIGAIRSDHHGCS